MSTCGGEVSRTRHTWLESLVQAYVLQPSNVQNLVKGPPAVVLADGVSLLEADMVVRRDEDADRVRL